MKEKIKSLLKKDKKTLTLMAVAVATILLLLISATYAYFAAQAGGGTGTDINAITSTTDSLSFSVGKDIEIKATMDNFYEGHESLKGSTTATATLIANNTTNSATARYNVFFIIDNNDFEYSTEDGQTELLMKVTDPNGNEVMDITGLKRVEGGFDITTRTGGFLIMADYDIEATPTETTKDQTWNLEITFVNLDADQNINKGKNFNGRFYITKEQENTYELAKINSIDATTTYNSIDATLNYSIGTAEIAKYYYAIEEDLSGVAYLGAGVSVARLSSLAINQSDYIESTEATYVFDNLKPNTKYNVYSYATDKYGVNSNVYETTVTTADYDLPQVTSLVHSETHTSITITATATGGTGEISKYYFSKDNGVTWSEGQESNVYTFTDLLDTTEYKIKVKVEDNNGIYSTEYYEAITTVTYINPSITIVNATKTYNSISLTTTAAGGTNSVSKYYYKVGTGSWSEAQTVNTYTITGLEENTTYDIYVKVEDAIGKASNEYPLDVTTNTYVVPSVSATISKTSNSITINATGTAGDGSIAKYMYSKDGGSNWTPKTSSSTTDSYTFESLTDNTTYQIRVKVVDNNERESSVYSTSVTTNTLVILASYVKSLYSSQGANDIYYHGTSLSNSARDNSYRYTGANPNNYVCFGTDAEECPEDNLYRIIGVFGNQVKLIKNTSIGNYEWSGSSSKHSNVWSESLLNTDVLNGTFLDGFTTIWKDKIAETTWYVGGLTEENALNNGAKTAYNYELGANKSNTTYLAKIGLMYLSEYYYAASPTYWTYPGQNSSDSSNSYFAARDSNWMYKVKGWTISPAIHAAPVVFDVYNTGVPRIAVAIGSTATRPTFVLNSGVTLLSGTGIQSDPYRIS